MPQRTESSEIECLVYGMRNAFYAEDENGNQIPKEYGLKLFKDCLKKIENPDLVFEARLLLGGTVKDPQYRDVLIYHRGPRFTVDENRVTEFVKAWKEVRGVTGGDVEKEIDGPSLKKLFPEYIPPPPRFENKTTENLSESNVEEGILGETQVVHETYVKEIARLKERLTELLEKMQKCEDTVNKEVSNRKNCGKKLKSCALKLQEMREKSLEYIREMEKERDHFLEHLTDLQSLTQETYDKIQEVLNEEPLYIVKSDMELALAGLRKEFEHFKDHMVQNHTVNVTETTMNDQSAQVVLPPENRIAESPMKRMWKHNMLIASGLFFAMGTSALWWLYTELDKYKRFHEVVGKVLNHLKPETFKRIVSLAEKMTDGEMLSKMILQAEASSRPVGAGHSDNDEAIILQMAKELETALSDSKTTAGAAIALIALILAVLYHLGKLIRGGKPAIQNPSEEDVAPESDPESEDEGDRLYNPKTTPLWEFVKEISTQREGQEGLI